MVSKLALVATWTWNVYCMDAAGKTWNCISCLTLQLMISISVHQFMVLLSIFNNGPDAEISSTNIGKLKFWYYLSIFLLCALEDIIYVHMHYFLYTRTAVTRLSWWWDERKLLMWWLNLCITGLYLTWFWIHTLIEFAGSD